MSKNHHKELSTTITQAAQEVATTSRKKPAMVMMSEQERKDHPSTLPAPYTNKGVTRADGVTVISDKELMGMQTLVPSGILHRAFMERLRIENVADIERRTKISPKVGGAVGGDDPQGECGVSPRNERELSLV